MDIFAAVQPFLTSAFNVSVSTPTPGAVVALIIACLLLMVSAFVSGSEIAKEQDADEEAEGEASAPEETQE